MKAPVTTGCALAFTLFALLANDAALGVGADHPTNHVSNSSWPKGMLELANSTNRVHGFWVNAEDSFFFSGSASEFTAFLAAYAKIEGIEKHRLILHDGVGEAKSPWGKSGRSCDWKLYSVPRSWLAADAKVKSFVLEVHFWMGGKIALEQAAIPKNIEFSGDYLKAFESITNGMTRAEVEKAFALDGGLQGASPVRLVHRSCPLFKVNVEFDFKRDAADQNRAITRPEDTVTHVSKPYFERPFMD
jgi:hypothetical protein